MHRTGIGAAYGRWYEQTTNAAVKLINEGGGIGGRPVEIIAEDDGTDPKRGRGGGGEVRHRAQGRRDLRHAFLACRHGLGAARGRAEDALLRGVGGPSRRVRRAQPLHLPARHHRREVAGLVDGAMDRRQSRQEGHDDLPGLRVRLRSPRLLLGRDPGAGRSGADADPDPADRKLLHQVLPADPRRYRGALPRDGRAGGAYLRQGARGASSAPRIRRSSASSTRSKPCRCRARGWSSWRAPISGRPIRATRRPTRREFDKFYREKVGVDANGASLSDANDISTYSHMFGCWETLYVIKQAMEASGYKSATDADKKAFIEATEAIESWPRATSTRRATRPSTERSTSASGTRTSRRWRAASSTSCTAPRSRTASTSRRRTTRRWRSRRTQRGRRRGYSRKAPPPRSIRSEAAVFARRND